MLCLLVLVDANQDYFIHISDVSTGVASIAEFKPRHEFCSGPRRPRSVYFRQPGNDVIHSLKHLVDVEGYSALKSTTTFHGTGSGFTASDGM